MDGLAVIEGDSMYHYRESGLDYIWLGNGFELIDRPDGQTVRIKQMNELHRAIARHIVTQPGKLRGMEVRFLRSMLRLSQDGLARALGQTRPSVARWEAEPGRSIPGASDHALRMFYTLKVEGHEMANRLVDLLTELDELQNGRPHERRMEFRDPGEGWKAAA
jgi:DNA-binding transcriptional regulator YiaG